MPLTIPTLDDRRYQDLLDEALARIPVHTPEWTNFNKSDPGVTLIEVFAFLTENLLYRSNQIPERNRRKFLKLIGVPLQAAASAQGLVAFSNERGPLETITLNTGLEVKAGQVPFRTTQGLDVLPIEAQIFYKRELKNPSDQIKSYYDQLYASFLNQAPSASAQLYETVAFPSRDASSVDLGLDSIDGSLWIALLVREGDKPADTTETAREDLRNEVRQKIGGKTLSLGIVPALSESGRLLSPGGQANNEGASLLKYEVPIGETLSSTASERLPRYRSLDSISSNNMLDGPGVVQISLPPGPQLKLWDNLDPLELGALDFPPALEDTKLNDRVLTWLRVRSTAPAKTRLLWAGINTTFVSQRAHIANEILPSGTGAPDQVVVLSKTPVIPESVRLFVITKERAEEWAEIDDLTAAGPEVPVRDPRLPPGSAPVINNLVKVFDVDAESGEVRFGDGLRGARPPLGAALRADYDYGVGRDGNVNKGAINSSPALPAGIKVTNPVATWGGAEAETVAEGEKQITRYLQNRERLVSAVDFETVTRRTPGVDIGRVEVLAAFSPELGSNEPGDAPGSVTLMIIPKYDNAQPDAPLPDRTFLDAICEYVDSRRLVTTEVFLRGPIYKQIWISIGIDVVAGQSVAEVREAVKQELLRFLSPLPGSEVDDPASLPASDPQRGWPLRKPVVALELMAVASRVSGVSLVNKVLLAEGTKPGQDQIEMQGLELPRVAGISVSVGEPVDLSELRGTSATSDAARNVVPVPVIPDEC
ncbi:MAG TPA: baseplate J/gp47 family protein [Blastocatellia bacterium]|nr:baseplate J/gp47 family protein [Blastocatellia bacterium]